MPVFFNPKQLTSDQLRNWDTAITEYARVKQLSSGSNVEPVAAEFGSQDVNVMRLSKSALFSRLLQGKSALPHPPPTSYAYPWYAVIEEFRAHQVRIEDGITYGKVNLNRCTWVIESMNDAAKDLWMLDRARRIGQWSPNLLQQVHAAYAKGPELVVHFNPWPRYRLFVGACDDSTYKCVKKYAQQILKAGVLPNSLSASVFDVDLLMLHAKFGSNIEIRNPRLGEDEWIELYFDRWHLELLN